MIELRGIVRTYEDGHTNTAVVVTVDSSAKYKRHLMGVDIKINRGKIITFLADLYDVPPGDIVWPDHIEL